LKPILIKTTGSIYEWVDAYTNITIALCANPKTARVYAERHLVNDQSRTIDILQNALGTDDKIVGSVKDNSSSTICYLRKRGVWEYCD
jgi:hypothetical protein